MDDDGVAAPERDARSRDDALAALWFDWDEAYVIVTDSDGQFRARRRDNLGEWMTAPDPDGLRQQIRDDYAMKPVPREPHAPDALPGQRTAGE